MIWLLYYTYECVYVYIYIERKEEFVSGRNVRMWTELLWHGFLTPIHLDIHVATEIHRKVQSTYRQSA